MPIVWDVGTAITGSGSLQLLGSYVRLELTTIPDYLSLSGAAPPLYRNLGLVGTTIGSARYTGEILRWPTQIIGPLPDDTDTLWYRLVNGVSGTAYRGVFVTTEPGIGAKVQNTANISIPNTTLTALTFNSERFDPFNMHDLAANTGRLTAPAPGWYSIGANVVWAANAAGYRQLRFTLNGGNAIGTGQEWGIPGGADLTRHSVCIVAWLNQGDYVECYAYQTSGGALNILYEASDSPDFWMVRVG